MREAETHASGEVRHHDDVSEVREPLEERGRLERVRAEGAAVPPDEGPDRDGVRAHRVVVVAATFLRSGPVYYAWQPSSSVTWSGARSFAASAQGIVVVSRSSGKLELLTA